MPAIPSKAHGSGYCAYHLLLFLWMSWGLSCLLHGLTWRKGPSISHTPPSHTTSALKPNKSRSLPTKSIDIHAQMKFTQKSYLKLSSLALEKKSGRVQKLLEGHKRTPDFLHPVYTDPKAKNKKERHPQHKVINKSVIFFYWIVKQVYIKQVYFFVVVANMATFLL